MELKEFCIPENQKWRSLFATAYEARFDDATVRTILEFKFPFSSTEEELLFTRFEIPQTARASFYENLLSAIQQNFKCAALLSQNNIASVLKYYSVEQSQEKNGTHYIWAETDHIVPFLSKYMDGSVSKATAINAFYRLALVLRDINNTPEQISVRGMDMHEVFVDDNTRILLGGFYYASGATLPPPPMFMPGCSALLSRNTADVLLEGQGQDMRILATYMWNLFSGLPMDTLTPSYYALRPPFASDDLIEIMELGMTGLDENVSAFRRKLGDYRKQLVKSAEGDEEISVYEPLRLEYRVDFQ